MIIIADGYSVILKPDKNESFGFGLRQLRPGLYIIANIDPQGSAYRNGRIRSGDVVTAVNDRQITEGLNIEMVTDMIRESQDIVKLMLIARTHVPGR